MNRWDCRVKGSSWAEGPGGEGGGGDGCCRVEDERSKLDATRRASQEVVSPSRTGAEGEWWKGELTGLVLLGGEEAGEVSLQKGPQEGPQEGASRDSFLGTALSTRTEADPIW